MQWRGYDGSHSSVPAASSSLTLRAHSSRRCLIITRLKKPAAQHASSRIRQLVVLYDSSSVDGCFEQRRRLSRLAERAAPTGRSVALQDRRHPPLQPSHRVVADVMIHPTAAARRRARQRPADIAHLVATFAGAGSKTRLAASRQCAGHSTNSHPASPSTPHPSPGAAGWHE